jgi:hypothetical protein
VLILARLFGRRFLAYEKALHKAETCTCKYIEPEPVQQIEQVNETENKQPEPKKREELFREYVDRCHTLYGVLVKPVAEHANLEITEYDRMEYEHFRWLIVHAKKASRLHEIHNGPIAELESRPHRALCHKIRLLIVHAVCVELALYRTQVACYELVQEQQLTETVYQINKLDNYVDCEEEFVTYELADPRCESVRLRTSCVDFCFVHTFIRHCHAIAFDVVNVDCIVSR